MEFYEIPIPSWEVQWNSMNLRNVEWHKISWNSSAANGLSTSSIEFYGIPWNSGAAKWNIIQFHGILWNFEIVILINTMLTCARFLSLVQSKLRLCSANHRPGYWSNQPCDWPSIAWAYSEQETENGPWTCMGYSMEFHGTLESPNKRSPSSMWFHGIRRAPFQMTQVFHGIFHGILWISGAAKWNIT